MSARIYTRQGDDGTTQHPNGSRVAKDHPDIQLLGALDELSAQIGLALSLSGSPDVIAAAGLHDLLVAIPQTLITLGQQLQGGPAAPGLSAATARLEQAIDELECQLPALAHFIRSGGHPAAAALHLARTVCRRAERRWVARRPAAAQPAAERDALAYLNRLSDLLFVAARAANQAAGCPEEPLP